MKKGMFAALFGLSFALMGQSALAQTSNSASPIDAMYNQIFTTPCLRRFATLYQQHERDMRAQVCIDRPEFNDWRRDCANETVELVRRWNIYCDPHVSSYAAILALPVRQASHTPTPPPQYRCAFRAHNRVAGDTTTPCVCPLATDIPVHVAGRSHWYGCALSEATAAGIQPALDNLARSEWIQYNDVICAPMGCAEDPSGQSCPSANHHMALADCREWRILVDRGIARIMSLPDISDWGRRISALEEWRRLNEPALAHLEDVPGWETVPGCEHVSADDHMARRECGMEKIILGATRAMPVIPPATAPAETRRSMAGVMLGAELQWQTGEHQSLGGFVTAGYYTRRNSLAGTGSSYWYGAGGYGNYGDGGSWMLRVGLGWAYNISDSLALSIGGTGHVVYDTEQRPAARNAIVDHLAFGVGGEAGLDWQVVRHLVIRLSCAVEWGRTFRLDRANRMLYEQTGAQIIPGLVGILNF